MRSSASRLGILHEMVTAKQSFALGVPKLCLGTRERGQETGIEIANSILLLEVGMARPDRSLEERDDALAD